MRAFFIFLLVFGATYVVFDFRSKMSAAIAPAIVPPPVVDHWAEEKVAARPTTPTPRFAAPAPTTPDEPKPLSPRDAEEANRAIWSQLNIEFSQRRAQFDAQIKALNLDRLFDAGVLINPDTYAPARQDIRTARRLTGEYETTALQQFKTIPARLKAAGLPEEMRNAALETFNSGPGSRNLFFQHVMSLDRKRLDELLSLLNFVEPRLDRMHVSGGALICDAAEDDAALLKHLQALAKNREDRQKLEADARAEDEREKKNLSTAQPDE